MSKLRRVGPALALCAAITCLLTLGAPRASADTITYNLTTGNAGGLGCCAGPYATVTVNRTSSTMATITFNTLTNGGFEYLMAGNSAADVNVNATTFTVSALAGVASPPGTSFANADLSNGGSGNVDGFGVFNLNINEVDGIMHSTVQISFNLTNTSGTWASAASVLSGGIAAIHGFACATPCTSTSSAFATGFANGATPIPEPASMALLGTALMGAYGLLRRRLLA